VEVAPAGVTRHVVVPVPGEPAKSRVQVPGEASGRVRDGPEVPVRAQVIDPGHRSVRASNHVLAAIVIEIAVAHGRYFTGLVPVRPWANLVRYRASRDRLPHAVGDLRDQFQLLLLN